MTGAKISDLSISFFQTAERDALCRRLGIEVENQKEVEEPFLGNLITWATIGMKLAENEPEFTGQTGKRGRPKLKSQRQKTDYERALFIVRLKARHEKNGDGRKLTDKALIELAQQESHLEFVNREIDSLTKSVSRGNSIIRDAEIKIRKIQAKKLRDSIRDFRQRTKRLKGIEPDSR
jgi:hypothetical protein